MKMKFIYFFSAALMLAACNNAGNESSSKDEKAESTENKTNDNMAADGVYKIAPEESMVKWNGEKVTGEHTGTVKVKEGSVKIENGEIAGGQIVMDMTTISNMDLKDDPESQAKLEGHLKSPDFFSVEDHPTATFEIKSAAEMEGNTVVTGALVIKGISEPATLTLKDANFKDGKMKASGDMTFDRTNYDIRFRSKKFFEDLGDKMIYDDVNLSFKVTAEKSGM